MCFYCETIGKFIVIHQFWEFGPRKSKITKKLKNNSNLTASFKIKVLKRMLKIPRIFNRENHNESIGDSR